MDIADVYLWHRDNAGEQNVVAAITFAGQTEAGGDAVYDADILYTINIDNTGDDMADETILVRFGQDCESAWGVQFEGVPGSDDTFSGAVDEALDGGGGVSGYAGPREDPFAFDFEGFVATATALQDDADAADLLFGVVGDPDSGTPDAFANTNVMAIVVEMPAAAVDPDDAGAISIWVTTGRL